MVYVGWGAIHLTAPLWAALVAATRGNWTAALTWLQEIGGRVAMLVGEIGAWIYAWVGPGSTPGPLVSLFWMALILWGCAAFAGWSVIRGRHPLFFFLPLIGALALSVYLGDAGKWHLLFLMACLVAMIPPTVLRRQERDWDSREMSYSEEFRFDVATVAFVSTILFVIAAVAFPNVRVKAVVSWFWGHSQGPQETVGRALEQTFPGTRPAARKGAETTGATLPREHLLGGDPGLERTLIMRVMIDDPPPVPDTYMPQQLRPRQIHYWLGTTYSDYVGVGWKRGETEASSLGAYASLGPPEQPGRRPLRQQFALLVPHGATLYAASEPQSVDQPVMAQRLPQSGDLAALEGEADRYRVLSLVPEVTPEELNAATAVYPAEIAELYLALPDDLPPRVVDLAREVTGGADTPYERALALESYLRSFPYDLKIAGPPEGRDVVDYFLFDLQRGYCDYFASAMVVMARAVRIPARLAVGYAMGHYDPQQGAYLVVEMDAHAWPELYFPGYGWIPFEPTSGFGRPERAAEAGQAGVPGVPIPSRPARSWWVRLQVGVRLWWLRWRWWVLAGVAVLGAIGLGWRVLRRLRYRPAGLTWKERVAWRYLQLQQAASRLRVPVSPSTTSGEFAAAVKQVLSRRRPRQAWWRGVVQREVERALAELSLLTRVYEQVSYAPVPPGPELLDRAWREGHSLRWRLRRLRVLTVARGGPSLTSSSISSAMSPDSMASGFQRAASS